MNISFDEKTKNALLNKIETNKSFRLMIKGFGWGGPTLGAVLDEQNEDDISENINGVKFIVNKDEEYIFDDCKIVYKKTFFGETFNVISNSLPNGSC